MVGEVKYRSSHCRGDVALPITILLEGSGKFPTSNPCQSIVSAHYACQCPFHLAVIELLKCGQRDTLASMKLPVNANIGSVKMILNADYSVPQRTPLSETPR